MSVHTVNFNEFSDNDYTLIGIHTTLSEYKLAYVLNKFLKVKFSRASFDLDFIQNKIQSLYTVYEYTDTELDLNWYLISNVYKSTRKTTTTSLFEQSESSTRLIKEKKKIDFFLKLEPGFDTNYILEIIDKINQMPQIITSYQLEVNTLKSKDFLIF